MSARGGKRAPVVERPVGLVRGTRDWLPADYARLAALERRCSTLLPARVIDRIRTPVLEFTELHERKSGAGIVSKLFELAGSDSAGICLRPELTAGIVRAYTAGAEPPSPPLAGEPLRSGLPLRDRPRRRPAPRVPPGGRRAARRFGTRRRRAR